MKKMMKQHRFTSKSHNRGLSKWLAVLLTVCMLATSSGWTTAAFADEPSPDTQTVVNGEQDTTGADQQSGDASTTGQTPDAAVDQGESAQDQNVSGGASAGQDSTGAGNDQVSQTPKAEENDSEEKDPYAGMMTINELKKVPDTSAKATIQTIGKGEMDTGTRGWSANIYYVNQPDNHIINKTEDFSLKYQLEFATAKDFKKGEVKIRVPRSFIKYGEGDEATDVLPDQIGVPKGTLSSPDKTKSSLFNYYVDQDSKELVFFNYEDIPENTAQAWQVLFEKIDVSKVQIDTQWAFAPTVKAGSDIMKSNSFRALSGTATYVSESDESLKEDPEDQNTDEEADPTGTVEGLMNNSEDEAGAVEEKGLPMSKVRLLRGSPSWSFNMYYVNQPDAHYVYKDSNFSLKYQMEFNTAETLPAYSVVIKVPEILQHIGHDGDSDYSIVSDIGVPQGSYNPATDVHEDTASDNTAFNYYRDGEGNLVFYNYRELDASENVSRNAIQVLYKDVDVFKTKDETRWTIIPDVTVTTNTGTEDDPQAETQHLDDSQAQDLTLEGFINTESHLTFASKSPYSNGKNYTPGLYTRNQVSKFVPDYANVIIKDGRNYGQKLGDKFEDYVYVVWDVNIRGAATQPYDVSLFESPSHQGFVVAVSPHGSNTVSSEITSEGTNEYTVIKYEKDNAPGDERKREQNYFNNNYYVVIAYPKDYVSAGTDLDNELEVEMIPVDKKDSVDRQYPYSNWIYKNYDWKYLGDSATITKRVSSALDRQLDSWMTTYDAVKGGDIDLTTAHFEVEANARNFGHTHVINEPHKVISDYKGVMGEYIPGTFTRVTACDDYVYATAREGSNSYGTYKLDQDDYYYNNVSISVSDKGYDVDEDEPSAFTPLGAPGTEGIDRNTDVYAMFADNPGVWVKVDSVPLSISGTASYRFTPEQIARGPYRVKAEHNAIDYSSTIKIYLGITIRGDSPVFNDYMIPVYENNHKASVTLENVSGLAAMNLIREPQSGSEYPVGLLGDIEQYNPSKYADWGDGNLYSDSQQTFNYPHVRARDSVQLLGDQKRAFAIKGGRAENDPKHGRAKVRYIMEASEGYEVFSKEAVGYLSADEENFPSPSRSEVVFYDLLPYGVNFDPSGTVTAGRLKYRTYSSADLSESKWDKNQVSVTVDPDTDIIKNYNGTGRTLVKLHVHYEGRDSSVIGLGAWYSGFGVAFDAYCEHKDFEAAKEEPNVVAYMPDDNNKKDIIGESNEVSRDNGQPVIWDNYSQYYQKLGSDINQDDNTDSRNVLYAGSQVFSDIAMGMASGIEKTVRSDKDTFGVYKKSTAVTPGENYEYKVTVKNYSATPVGEIVIFDRLENALTDHPASEAGAFDDQDWNGSFVDVNVNEAKAAGANPVVWYNARRDAPVPSGTDDPSEVLTADNGWVRAASWSGDKSDVKAVAVSLGTSFELDLEGSVSVYMEMKAPESLPEDAVWAYNNAGFASSSEGQANKYDTTSSTRVKIVKASELELEKELADGTPAERQNDKFKFTLTWGDGSKDYPFSYKQYKVLEKDADGNWIEQSGIHATDADGSLYLKGGQKVVFTDIDAKTIKVKEKESVRWTLDDPSLTGTYDEEEGKRTILAVNTYHPVLYVKKDVEGYAPQDAAEINLQEFKMKAVNADGEPLANTKLYVVNSAMTNGNEPVVINGTRKAYGNLGTPASLPAGADRVLSSDGEDDFSIYHAQRI